MEDVKFGTIIQINEHNPNLEIWCGCTMIVDEVMDWGVLAGLKIPNGGTAYLRVRHGDYDIIGDATLVPIKD